MPSKFVSQYEVEKVTVTWNGRIFTGFSSDSQVTIEQETQAMTPYVGVTGETVLAYSSNTNAMVTLSLHHASPDNAYLEAALKARTLGPIQIQDRNMGLFICRAAVASVMTRPGNARGAEVGAREWVLYVVNMQSET